MEIFTVEGFLYQIKPANNIDVFNRNEFSIIPDFEDYYINGFGVVYSTRSGNFLNSFFNDANYLAVCLYQGKNQKTRSLHKLIARTFIPNPNNYKYVEFIDNTNRNRTQVDNIKWSEKKRVSTEKKRPYANKGFKRNRQLAPC
jgi:hypothetical protein